MAKTFDKCKLCGQSKFLNFMGLCKRCGKDPKAHDIIEKAVSQRQERLDVAAIADAEDKVAAEEAEALEAEKAQETADAKGEAKSESKDAEDKQEKHKKE